MSSSAMLTSPPIPLRKFSNSVATCVCPPPGWNSCCIIGMKASGARKALAPPCVPNVNPVLCAPPPPPSGPIPMLTCTPGKMFENCDAICAICARSASSARRAGSGGT